MKSYSLVDTVYTTDTYCSPSIWEGQPRLPSGNKPRAQRDFTAGTSRAGDFKAPNPHSFNIKDYQNFEGRMRRVYHGSAYKNDSYEVLGHCGVAPLDQEIDNTLKNAAYNQALSSLNEQIRGEIDLSIDAFQMNQTRRMLRGSTRLIESIIRTKKHLTKGDWRALTRGTGGKWLEAQYGWFPLISTIFDSFEKIVDPSSPNWDRYIEARGTATNVEKSTFSVGPLTGDKTVQLSYRCQLGVIVKPTSSRLQALAGYTSLNPLSIGWELLPFSFIVDWFFSIGDYLRNAESALLYSSSFVSGYRTDTRMHVCECVPKPYRNTGTAAGTYELWYTGRRSVGTFKGLERSILSSYPSPTRPRFRANLGSGRMLNAAALLSQLLGRR